MTPPASRAGRCIGEPVSWLRLERYHAGELAAESRAAIATHLAACPACAACLAQIEEDQAVALPALPAAAARPATSRAAPSKVVWLRSSRAMAAVGALAMAAAVVLGIGRGWWRTGVESGGTVATAVRVKGGSVAFTLVREDSERIEGARGIYRDGDRFKVLVTCPPTYGAGFDVVVFEEGAPSFPLAPAPAFACGNLVPLPGAMRLTGNKRETVCVTWNEEGPVDRAAAGPRSARTLCKDLDPAR